MGYIENGFWIDNDGKRYPKEGGYVQSYIDENFGSILRLREMYLLFPSMITQSSSGVRPSFLLTFEALHTNVIVILFQFDVKQYFTKTKIGLSRRKNGLRF